MRRGRSHALGRLARVLSFTLLFVAALAARPLEVRADSAAEARFHDARARAHFRARDFTRAIDEFLWANRIAPNARLVYNVALCFEQLDDAENAFAYFAEYLASEDTSEGFEERRASAQRTLDALRDDVARVRVTSDPPGAVIHVDTEDHGTYGVAPRTVAVPPGRHVITLSAEGYESASATVEVARGTEAHVALTLRRHLGTLRLEVREPTPVVVRQLDGTLAAEGMAPVALALPPGAYTVSGGDGVHEVVATVATVRANETTEASLLLVAVPVPSGEATVTSNGEGSLVLLDGVEVGFTPAIVRGVAVGRHTLRLQESGRDPWEGEIDVRDAERTWVTATLRASGRRRRSPVGLAIGAVGLAGLASVAVTGPMALRAHREFDRVQSSDPAAAVNARERGRILNRATDALLGVGGALFATGLTLTFVLRDPHDAPSSARVSFGAP